MQRLTGAAESPGSSFAYSYDLAGNRTGVTVDGTAVLTDTYDAADQVVGWTYDNAGNLTSDGTTSYSYDATNDLTGTTTTGQSRAYSYNGDGTLVAQTANGTTTDYTQDLASYQSQILAGTVGMTTTDYLYGQNTAPLAALTGGTRTWYSIDGQGSVRQSLDDSGNVLGVQSYDPFGQIEAGSSLVGPFGYTGELQDAGTGQEYLRARWYQPGSGTLLGVDPLLDVTGQPYSYAYDDPVNGSDPSGLCAWYDVVCEYNAAHTAAQQSSFGRGFYAGTTGLIRGIGTEAGAIGNTTVSCLNPFDQTNCRNQRAANAATFAYISAHPTEALRSAIDAAAQPYACGDIAYDLGYGLPQLFLGALGAFGEGADVLADTAQVEPGLVDLSAEVTDAANNANVVTSTEFAASTNLGTTDTVVGLNPADRYRLGVVRTFKAEDYVQALFWKENLDAYLQAVADWGGLNLRGVRIVYDESLGYGTLGKTSSTDRGWIIRIGRASLTDEYTALNTLAHELNHARDIIKHDFFLVRRIAEPIAVAAGDAAEAWARGRR